MNSSQDLPPLQDFEQQLKQLKNSKPKNSGSDDYTKFDPKYMDEEDQNKQIKIINQKMQNIALDIQKKKEKIAKSTNHEFGGFKKGFLIDGGNNQIKQTKITQVKANKNKNPLEIKEVQQAMKMNDYLSAKKSEWMTQDFLQLLTKDKKISKLFQNPQYMKAIDMFKTNPKQAMIKYGGNKQFMQCFQQFCKAMGMQFQNLSKNSK